MNSKMWERGYSFGGPSLYEVGNKFKRWQVAVSYEDEKSSQLRNILRLIDFKKENED